MKLTLIYCSHLILRSHCFDGCSNNIPYDILSVFLSLGTCLFLIYIIMCTYVLSFNLTINTFSSVQSLCHVRLFATPGTTALQVSLSFTNSQSSPKPMSIESVMPSNHLILCCTLLLLPLITPSIRVFPMSQLFTWGGQSIGVSASASVHPRNTQDWSPLRWTGWISLQSKGLSSVFSNTTVQKHQFFGAQLSSESNSHIHTWLLELWPDLCQQSNVSAF